MALSEGQLQLQAPQSGNYSAIDLTFGTVSTGVWLLNPLEITYADGRYGDVDQVAEDGIRMGRDYRGAATVSMDLAVDTVDLGVSSRYAANLNRVGVIMAAWRADSRRFKAGAVASLSVCKGGRTRRLYGRPRRIATADTQFDRQGFTKLTAEFQAVDDLIYDDAATSATVIPGIAYRERGIGSHRWKVSTGGVTPAIALVAVGGTLPTWPVIVLNGPLKNPKLTLDNHWTFQLTTTIADGDSVTIDTRPWARTAVHSSGASMAAKFTRASPRLSEMQLPAGHVFARLTYSNTVSATNRPSCVLTWRSAYSYL